MDTPTEPPTSAVPFHHKCLHGTWCRRVRDRGRLKFRITLSSAVITRPLPWRFYDDDHRFNAARSSGLVPAHDERSALAEKFYKTVMGSTAAPFAASPEPYTVFKRSGDGQVAGLDETPDDMKMPPFSAMYVGTRSSQTRSRRSSGSGQRMSPVIDVPTVGRLQMLRDPQGAAFSSFSLAGRKSVQRPRRKSARPHGTS